MDEYWEYGICDENGDTYPMPERMARAAVAHGRAHGEHWHVRRRRIQEGDYERVAAGGEA